MYFSRDVLEPANPTLADAVSHREPGRRHRIFVVVDSGVADTRPRFAAELAEYAEAHRDRLELAAAPEVVAGGERIKSDSSLLTHLLTRFREHALDRQSCVMIVGGGAVQDTAGYAAAIAHRGLRVVRVPTTVEAQNDSGVGVKNGMNALGAKNFVGTFSPPFAVVNDSSFLRTLPMRERVAGIAEAVKVALIRDAVFFEWLEAHADDLAAFAPDVVEEMVRRSAELHLAHIAGSGDPFEFGNAKPLDYGHWLAHQLEIMTGYELRHGEAVAIGIAADARYACEIGMLEASPVQRICTLLERCGLTLRHDALSARDSSGRLEVLHGLREFREHLGGEMSITLLRAIGAAVDVHEIDEAVMARAIGWLEARRRAAA